MKQNTHYGADFTNGGMCAFERSTCTLPESHALSNVCIVVESAALSACRTQRRSMVITGSLECVHCRRVKLVCPEEAC